LSDGSELSADVIVVGVGVARDLEWLVDAGLEVHDGLVCDDSGRTSIPGIFGAGDIVCRHVDGVCTQIQHWTAAGVSGRRVAHAVLSMDATPVPDDGYFWSDQYGLRIQFAGHSEPFADMEVASGSIDDRVFTLRWTVDGRVVGVLGVNSPKEFMRLRLALRSPGATSKAGVA
jgi:3-phenylpropionate/trans-cinnamate dioxygenase ferredoxin reductase subunit